jgi:hypothetical protein
MNKFFEVRSFRGELTMIPCAPPQRPIGATAFRPAQDPPAAAAAPVTMTPAEARRLERENDRLREKLAQLKKLPMVLGKRLARYAAGIKLPV